MTATRSARALLADATVSLAAAGVPTPRVDAELLLAHVLGIRRSRVALVDTIGAGEAQGFARAVERRATREPLQHITGRAPFRHLELAVGPGVFVPRPETELLVDAVGRVTGRVVDLCAGSGALALSVATECPGTEVWAVERSSAALAWLRRNVAASPAADRVHMVEADVSDPALLTELRGTFAAVLSNPPYVRTSADVAPEVHADPAEAVFAGPDGLGLLPAVIARAGELLAPGGVLAMEHDGCHRASAFTLVEADGRFVEVRDHDDLAGQPRFVTARRR